MRRTGIFALALVLALSACGSRLNPFNWFGQSERAQVAATPVPGAPVDHRLLVAEVTSLTLDRMPGGVIVRAVGLPPTQGYWEAELVERKDPANPDVAVFDFRVFPPIERAEVSTRQSREVVVATFLTDIRLANLRQITVQGQNSALTTRR